MPSAEECNALGYLRDFFRQSRDALGLHKDKVEVLLGQMDDTMTSNPAPTSLWRRMEQSERAWFEFEKHYNQLRAAAGYGQLQNQGDAEQDRNTYVSLQHRYLNVLSRARDALGVDQDEGDDRPREPTPQQKVEQFMTRWNGLHHRIDEALKELEASLRASLEGDPAVGLDVLNVKEYQLMRAKDSLKETSNLVSLMVIEDPSRSSELWGLEEARALEIVTKVSAIEESIAKILGVINGKRVSTTEAIAPAINELIKALGRGLNLQP